MKRFLMALGCLTVGGSALAVTSGPVSISSGTSFYQVDTSSISSRATVRQNIVIGDPNTAGGLAPVDPLNGLAVYLTTGTGIVTASSVTVSNFPATQAVSGSVTANQGTPAARFWGTDLSTGVQVNGTVTATQGTPAARFWGVDLSTGISGTVTSNQGTPAARFWGVDLSTGISGTVTANQGTPSTRFPGVDLSTGVNVNGTVTANAGTPGTRFPGVDLSTGIVITPSARFIGVDHSTGVQVNGTVTSTQGTPALRFWGIELSTGILVANSTITIQSPNNNTTAIPVSGSFSTTSVQVSTAAYSAPFPGYGMAIGAVGPTGTFQSFAVDVSSNLKVAGSFSATATQVSTSAFGTAYPGYGNAPGFVGPTGAMQGQRVNLSSDAFVAQGNAGTIGWKIDLSTGVQDNQGTPNARFWSVDLSTGAQVNGTVTATQGTPAARFWGVDLSSGVRALVPSASGTGSVVPSSANYIAGNGSGNLTGIVVCDTQTVINTSSSGDILISTNIATSGQVIYICSFSFMAGGTSSVNFEEGINTTCGTNTLAKTGAYPLIAQTGIAQGNGIGAVIRGSAGQQMCLKNGSAVSLQGVVNWTKF